jgi:multidrug efflux pump subunit AcrB
MPVVASTATTVAAFAPMLFWPGIMGEFMSYLPLTLIFTLSSSLFVALVINPVVTGIFVRIETEERPRTARALKIVGRVAVAAVALIVLIANPISLGVLVFLFGVLYAGHRWVLKPIGDRFIQTGLPRFVDRYRTFLRWMLERDYSVGRALLRNTFALGSFTAGAILLVIGGVVGAMAGQAASMVALVPGGLLLLVGTIGILFHTLEWIFIGRSTSVRAGGAFAAVVLAILGAMSLGSKELTLGTVINLLIMPAVIMFIGVLGVLFAKRAYYVLTDNRARLINGVLGGLFAIIGMFVYANPGTELFPDTDPNIIQITFRSALGTNVDQSNAVAYEANARLQDLMDRSPVTNGAIKNVQTNVGIGGDLMFGGGAAAPEVAQLTLNMIKYGKRDESSKVTMQRIREVVSGMPGVDTEFTTDQAGPPTGAPVNIEISGEDFMQIVRIAREVRSRLESASQTDAIMGLVDITDNLKEGRPEMQIRIDRERAARAGLSTSMIASSVRAAVNGIEAGKYRESEEEYDITVRLAEADRSDLSSLRNLTIVDEGQQIPLTSVADFELGGGLGSVTRLDLERVVTVSSEVLPGYNGQQVLTAVQEYLAEYRESLPAGYNLSYTGESEDQQEAFGFLTNALLIAVALIFMIMVAQFNKVSMPFIIMVAVGLSLIGVLLGLVLTRTPFGLMTFIGVISLAGIVVNNNIVLIDYIMQLRDRGLGKTEAIIEGGATRLRPVLLTALTTIIGLIPLTLGIGIDFVDFITNLRPNFQFGSENTQFWGPMGTSIIAGLTFATFLTLVIVPVLYSVFDSLTMRFQSAFGSPDLRGELEQATVEIGGNGSAGQIVGDVRTPSVAD